MYITFKSLYFCLLQSLYRAVHGNLRFYLIFGKIDLFRVTAYLLTRHPNLYTYVMHSNTLLMIRYTTLCTVLEISSVARNLIWGVYVLTIHCNFKTCVNVPHVNKTVTDFGGIYIPI